MDDYADLVFKAEKLLKPCPFCGNTARLISRTQMTYNPQFHGVRGVVCGCGAVVYGRDEYDASYRWNRRVDDGN